MLSALLISMALFLYTKKGDDICSYRAMQQRVTDTIFFSSPTAGQSQDEVRGGEDREISVYGAKDDMTRSRPDRGGEGSMVI